MRNTVPIVSILFVLIFLSASVGTSFSITSSVTSYDNTITVIGPSPGPDPVIDSIGVGKEFDVIPSDLHGYEIVSSDKGPITNNKDRDTGFLRTTITIDEPMEIAVYCEITGEQSTSLINVHDYGFQTLYVHDPIRSGYLGDGRIDGTIVSTIKVNPDDGVKDLLVTIVTMGNVRIFFEIQPYNPGPEIEG